MKLDLLAPQPLASHHTYADFCCGERILDDWLKRKALVNQASGASRTFVATDSDQRVWGYYAMAAGAVSHQLATGNIRRNMPDPVPVLVLGRLAVDRRAQGIKLGGSLLQDAFNRAINVAENTGVRALLVHALSESAKRFYEYYGFKESPADPLVLMLRLNQAS
ncbi:hypothetical protein XMA121_000107 [Marinobacterium sp. xm-a-121]|uniref:GNAT family N-acetyltransferase n=1 Tax=unclassified Marinobacterium TaxID=2644139 RepID=UPI00156A5A00|nr:hypothetical protein [Marinobacterium sp. xm-a-121]NRP99866.1 hypothetical protein [Marinobacterium sp. xm-v-233]